MIRVKGQATTSLTQGAYALERVEVAPEVEGQRVQWLEVLDGTARELLSEAEADNEDGSTASGVDAFLRATLADRPMSAKAIRADADGAGYGWRSVQASATRLGVERRKDGMKGGWVWALTQRHVPRRCSEGAEDAPQKERAPSVSSSGFAAPSADVEVI